MGRGGIPFLSLGEGFFAGAFGSSHDAFDVPFHALLVEAIEFQVVGGRGAGGAGARDLFDSVEGVDEYAVWLLRLLKERPTL